MMPSCRKEPQQDAETYRVPIPGDRVSLRPMRRHPSGDGLRNTTHFSCLDFLQLMIIRETSGKKHIKPVPNVVNGGMIQSITAILTIIPSLHSLRLAPVSPFPRHSRHPELTGASAQVMSGHIFTEWLVIFSIRDQW